VNELQCLAPLDSTDENSWLVGLMAKVGTTRRD
jgi:hypothetical protein